jgi:hypothetical protein
VLVLLLLFDPFFSDFFLYIHHPPFVFLCCSFPLGQPLPLPTHSSPPIVSNPRSPIGNSVAHRSTTYVQYMYSMHRDTPASDRGSKSPRSAYPTDGFCFCGVCFCSLRDHDACVGGASLASAPCSRLPLPFLPSLTLIYLPLPQANRTLLPIGVALDSLP